MSVPRKVASLDASLLFAKKGEAVPAMKQTIQNNPSVAWGAPRDVDDMIEHQQPRQNSRQQSQQPSPREGQMTSSLSVTLDEDLFLRLKYLAQQNQGNMHNILNEALERHLSRNGVFKALKLAVKPH